MKHGKDYAKHDASSLGNATDKSTDSIRDKMFAAHRDRGLPRQRLPARGAGGIQGEVYLTLPRRESLIGVKHRLIA